MLMNVGILAAGVALAVAVDIGMLVDVGILPAGITLAVAVDVGMLMVFHRGAAAVAERVAVRVHMLMDVGVLAAGVALAVAVDVGMRLERQFLMAADPSMAALAVNALGVAVRRAGRFRRLLRLRIGMVGRVLLADDVRGIHLLAAAETVFDIIIAARGHAVGGHFVLFFDARAVIGMVGRVLLADNVR